MILGIDIGTTTISFVVINENKIIYSVTKNNDSSIDIGIQDPNRIISICLDTLENIKKLYKIDKIGISNQMHGMLFVDKNGKALSNLFTWQNMFGKEISKDNKTYLDIIYDLTNTNLSTGFGTCTYFVLKNKNMLPNNIYKMVTIGDYLVMVLTDNLDIKMHSSNASSFGLYDIENNCFNNELISKLGLNTNYYLNITNSIEIMGTTKDNIKIINAVGDNQCSVYALSNKPGSLIINFGTGSQISYITDKLINHTKDYEIRPFINDTYLIVGCALSGGYSYSLLRKFFNSLNIENEISYDYLNELVKDTSSSNGIIFNPKFLGTRKNPSITGSIEGLTESNFKVNYFIYALLEGMVDELYQIFNSYKEYTNVILFTGSGNGLIKNKKLIEIVEQKFNRKLSLSTIKEEAAYGAAKLTELV